VFDLILDSPWAGSLIWMALYISDYYFTIACARLYRAQDKIVFEGILAASCCGCRRLKRLSFQGCTRPCFS
jgi:hypothetical protein